MIRILLKIKKIPSIGRFASTLLINYYCWLVLTFGIFLQADKRPIIAPYNVCAAEWLDGSSRYSLQYGSGKGWKSKDEFLAARYLAIWWKKTAAKPHLAKSSCINGEIWLRLLLFSPSSRAIRETVCGILEHLCKVRFTF